MSGLIKFGTIINIIGGVLVLYSFLPQIYTILKTENQEIIVYNIG